MRFWNGCLGRNLLNIRSGCLVGHWSLQWTPILIITPCTHAYDWVIARYFMLYKPSVWMTQDFIIMLVELNSVIVEELITIVIIFVNKISPSSETMAQHIFLSHHSYRMFVFYLGTQVGGELCSNCMSWAPLSCVVLSILTQFCNSWRIRKDCNTTECFSLVKDSEEVYSIVV